MCQLRVVLVILCFSIVRTVAVAPSYGSTTAASISEEQIVEQIYNGDQELYDKVKEVQEEMNQQAQDKLDSMTQTEKDEITMMQQVLSASGYSIPPGAPATSPAQLNARAGVRNAFIEGDMLLNHEQADFLIDSLPNRSKRQAIKRGSALKIWAGPVPYLFDASVSSAITHIQQAIKFWNDSTCINFVPRTTQSEALRFFRGAGCYSMIGKMTGTFNDVSIGIGCELHGTIAHEIAHSLGFFHTQTRHDRDNFVVIDLEKVQGGMTHNYAKMDTTANDNLGVPYEYGSVMHYGPSDFGINGQTVMLARDPKMQTRMGALHPSFTDVLLMNKLYSCEAKCPSGPSCRGTMRHPRDCTKCLCPEPWTGADCSQLSGPTFTASSSPQQLRFGTPANPSVPFSKTYRAIKAPLGSRVEVKFEAISLHLDYCSPQCATMGIELIDGAEKMSSGQRLCCPSQLSTTWQSKGNEVVIVQYMHYLSGNFDVTVSHKIVGGAPEPPSPPPPQPPSACSDSSTNCATWASNGFCSNIYYTNEQKKETCGKTCNLCTPTTPSCADSNVNCATWKTNGFCTSPYYANDQKKEFCSKSCGYC